MNRLYLTVAAIGVSAALAACGPKKEEAVAPAPAEPMAPPAAAPAGGDMKSMDMSASTKMARGEGTVTAIDKAAGSITLDHGPIPEANWGPMTMSFKAAPAVLDAVKAGDKVAFDLKLEGTEGEVTAIRKK